MSEHTFPTTFSRDIFRQKYANGPNDTWPMLARRVVEDVCGSQWGKTHPLLSKEARDQLVQFIIEMKFIPAGRYLYYAGRPAKFFNNCYCLRAEEDTREEWAKLTERAMNALMSGGGIGCDYSILRPSGRMLARTGGISSGPIPLMHVLNEAGRNVMQGGSRRSALYASLHWAHEDIESFMYAKRWSETIKALKEQDINFPAPLDMTNISINWDDSMEENDHAQRLFLESVGEMCRTGEPGHSYNFGPFVRETLRNACTEFTSEDDSDVCNLGSVNLGNIRSLDELADVCYLGSAFLACGTMRADVPYSKVREVRERNRKLGLGLMGIHEWLLKRGHSYGVNPELEEWLKIYVTNSEAGANDVCDRFYLNRPKRYRAIAPTGTIGILAATTTGIEPVYAVAYKRRYLESGTKWRYRYVIDATAQRLINEGVDPDKIETAYDLAKDVERRVKFQADVQQYVDMGVASTINLPEWGSKYNNPDTVPVIADILNRYRRELRGITCYPDGARGGQPLTVVKYSDAIGKQNVVFDEIEDKCKGGLCGI